MFIASFQQSADYGLAAIDGDVMYNFKLENTYIWLLFWQTK